MLWISTIASLRATISSGLYGHKLTTDFNQPGQ